MQITSEGKQKIVGIIRHLDGMTLAEKQLYHDIMTKHVKVAELIQNESKLTPGEVEYFERVQKYMKHGNTAKAAEMLRT